MSVYNGAKYLREAIDSVLTQSMADFEFLIVNDGSMDNSLEIIKSYNDARIILLDNEKNLGLIASLNKGLAVARGKYLARFDADDICCSNRLEEQYNFLENNPDIAVCGSWAEIIDENGKAVDHYNYPPLENKAIKKYLFWHNPFIHPTVMVRREILAAAGGYNKKFKHIEDYELWTRVLAKFQGANIPQTLIKYRRHSGGITKKNNLVMRWRGIMVRLLVLIRR